MANINVVNLGGKKVGEFELADEVFAGEINDGLLSPRFAPSQRAWVLSGTINPVNPAADAPPGSATQR